MSKPVLDRIIGRAAADLKRIVLPESHDPRVLAACAHVRDRQIAIPILVGNADQIAATAKSFDIDVSGISCVDPLQDDGTEARIKSVLTERSRRRMSLKRARALVEGPLACANLMVKIGQADGTVAGAATPTPKVVRMAMLLIGVAADAPLVSSFFLMIPPSDAGLHQDALIFADCGLNIQPNAEQLAHIAAAAARSAQSLLQTSAQVAMLSFSTDGSARHAAVDHVAAATARLRVLCPDLSIDGEVQFDAAVVPSVADKKIAHSQVGGQANVLVFPNLDAGNIGYKIAERIGRCQAIGPILQGLAAPANDLSRGCSVDDIVHVIAITAVQAQETS